MATTSKIGIFFIHGAGLNGQIWQKVVELLNFPFTYADYSSLYDKSDVTLEDYVSVACDQACSLNTDKIVIVAHSIGGVVGTEIMKRLEEEDRVAGFIGISAAIPKPGHNFISTLLFPQKHFMPIMLRLFGTKPPESVIRRGLCLDLTKEQSEKIAADYKREATRLFLDDTSPGTIPPRPSFYIKTLNDKEFTPAAQEHAIRQLHDPKFYTIASGHMPMISHPKLIAKYIHYAIARIVPVNAI